MSIDWKWLFIFTNRFLHCFVIKLTQHSCLLDRTMQDFPQRSKIIENCRCHGDQCILYARYSCQREFSLLLLIPWYILIIQRTRLCTFSSSKIYEPIGWAKLPTLGRVDKTLIFLDPFMLESRNLPWMCLTKY